MWNEEKPIDEITMKEIEETCEKAFLIKQKCESIEEELDKHKVDLKVLQTKIQAYLEHFGKNKWESQLGVFEVRQKLSVKIPRAKEDKEALFQWLQNKNIFWEMVNINSQTLNSLYNSEFESAESPDFKIPGVGEPEVYKTINMKVKK